MLRTIGDHEVIVNLWLIILAGGIFVPASMLISTTEAISLFARVGPLMLAWVHINSIRTEIGLVNCYVAIEYGVGG